MNTKILISLLLVLPTVQAAGVHGSESLPTENLEKRLTTEMGLDLGSISLDDALQVESFTCETANIAAITPIFHMMRDSRGTPSHLRIEYTQDVQEIECRDDYSDQIEYLILDLSKYNGLVIPLEIEITPASLSKTGLYTANMRLDPAFDAVEEDTPGVGYELSWEASCALSTKDLRGEVGGRNNDGVVFYWNDDLGVPEQGLPLVCAAAGSGVGVGCGNLSPLAGYTCIWAAGGATMGIGALTAGTHVSEIVIHSKAYNGGGSHGAFGDTSVHPESDGGSAGVTAKQFCPTANAISEDAVTIVVPLPLVAQAEANSQACANA